MNRIKELREELGWTQNDLAQKMDCAPSSIAMYEKEERKPSLDVLVKLAELFNCSIDYLLCKNDEKGSTPFSLTTEDMNFIKSIKRLDDVNKMIIRNTMEALLDKQEKDEKKED